MRIPVSDSLILGFVWAFGAGDPCRSLRTCPLRKRGFRELELGGLRIFKFQKASGCWITFVLGLPPQSSQSVAQLEPNNTPALSIEHPQRQAQRAERSKKSVHRRHHILQFSVCSMCRHLRPRRFTPVFRVACLISPALACCFCH